MKRIALNQDTESLLKINHFDYDLTNADFVNYFTDRTGILIRHNLDCLGNKVLKSDTAWNETIQDINNPVEKFQFIIRARVQDCWEIFQGVN